MSPRAATAFLLLVHAAATLVFLPPDEILKETPLYTVDYPVHTHRVHVYREALWESGVPWGYDPGLSGGTVMNPGQDVGAKPLQVLSVLLPFLAPGAVVRLLLFLAVLSLPLWIVLGCRAAGVDPSFWPWILLVTIAPAWLDARINGFWHWGLVCFATASFFSLFVLGLFLQYAGNPSSRSFLKLAAAASALLLLHILGPVIVAPALVLATLLYPPLRLGQRMALMAVPVVALVVNAFWLLPLLLAQSIPQPQNFRPAYPPDSVVHLQFGEGSVLLSPFEHLHAMGPIIVAICLATYDLIVLGRSGRPLAAGALGVTCAFGLFVTLFGSDLPVFVTMQPVRFIVPTFVFMAVPIGVSIGDLVARMRLPSSPLAAGVALALSVSVPWLGLPRPLDLPPSPDPLVEFIRAETPTDARVLIQSHDGHKFDGYETKVFDLITGREVIGSNFPLIYDPPQFLNSMLLGRRISEWEPESLAPALRRWGVGWVFTTTAEAESLMVRTLGEPVRRLTRYAAFEIPDPSSLFLAGHGSISRSVNRIQLSALESDGGMVILRYRYHPAWRATPDVPILRYPVPEDLSGFIALSDPPERLLLEFDAWGMLRAPWPDPLPDDAWGSATPELLSLDPKTP